MRRKDIFSENYLEKHFLGEFDKVRVLFYILSLITIAESCYIIINFKAITVIIAATVAGLRW